MRIDEITEGNAAQLRVQRLKANAKLAKSKSAQMKDQADLSADIFKQRQARQKAAKERKATVTQMIKPYR